MFEELFQILIPTAVTALFGWIWAIDRKVALHDQVIEKMDKLTDLLLNRELDRDK